MQHSFLAIVLSALPFVFAQNGALITIDVGKDGLVFTPNSITANVGDQVEFLFYPRTHSVVESTFDSPCAPLADGTGFFSGGFATPSGQNDTSFTITVKDTNPIWFYCGAPGHCSAGMGGVINPPASGQTLDAYLNAAGSVSSAAHPSTVQGGVIGPAKPAHAGSVSSSTSSTAPTSAAKPTSAQSPTSASSPPKTSASTYAPSPSSKTSAATAKTSPNATASPSSGSTYTANPAPTTSPTPLTTNAGISAQGSVQWVMLGAASVVAAVFGGLIL